MNHFASQKSPINSPLQLSPESESVEVKHLQNPPGEGNYYSSSQHTLFISLASRPVRYLQKQGDRTYTGTYRQGDMLITPAKTPLYVDWQDDEDCLQLSFNSQLTSSVAHKTLDRDPDRIKLLPAFQLRDSQLQAIAMMLFEEMQSGDRNTLYLDSLTNVLAVNLLRHHTASKPQVSVYPGGLPPRQLSKILDYVDANLAQKISLADLANLIDLSSFHFSRMFERSLGIPPYQYLNQQRIEYAKQLLKQTDLLITDIALECGFSSHSHFGKTFKQMVGTTPKQYKKSR
ncbi:MAG: AraC family transcriptional regulator [Cyanobacteria bacterium P01_G01_bin.19]